VSEAWKSYPGAPVPGFVLCALVDVPDGGSYSVNIGDFPVLLARRGEDVWAYVNACPHQFLPLDWRQEDVVTSDGNKLMCSNHEATFEIETGCGVGGFGQGCTLDPVPVRFEDGQILIA